MTGMTLNTASTLMKIVFLFQAEDGRRCALVTGVQSFSLPIPPPEQRCVGRRAGGRRKKKKKKEDETEERRTEQPVEQEQEMGRGRGRQREKTDGVND